MKLAQLVLIEILNNHIVPKPTLNNNASINIQLQHPNLTKKMTFSN